MIRFREGEIKNILPINLITPEVQALSYSIGNAMKDMVKFSASALCIRTWKMCQKRRLTLLQWN